MLRSFAIVRHPALGLDATPRHRSRLSARTSWAEAVRPMSIKRAIVRGLNDACWAVDEIAYRPVVVRLTLWLPRWWRCDLARLSMYLDDRWGLDWWRSDDAPPAPSGVCAACKRRAAWLVLGGRRTAMSLRAPTWRRTRSTYAHGAKRRLAKYTTTSSWRRPSPTRARKASPGAGAGGWASDPAPPSRQPAPNLLTNVAAYSKHHAEPHNQANCPGDSANCPGAVARKGETFPCTQN